MAIIPIGMKAKIAGKKWVKIPKKKLETMPKEQHITTAIL